MPKIDQHEDSSVGKPLHPLRTRAPLTQTTLAEQDRAHRRTASFWERGEYLPETLPTVRENARVLQLAEANKRLLVEALRHGLHPPSASSARAHPLLHLLFD